MGDLHQYVIEEDPVRVKIAAPIAPQKGPRVINLDDRYVPHSGRNPRLKAKYSDPHLYLLPNLNGLDHPISPFTYLQLNCRTSNQSLKSGRTLQQRHSLCLLLLPLRPLDPLPPSRIHYKLFRPDLTGLEEVSMVMVLDLLLLMLRVLGKGTIANLVLVDYLGAR